MYESEINHRVEELAQIPPEVVQQFTQFRAFVDSRTVLPWSEHCTECVWPSCYTTCELYSPREDGRCRRFVDGMVRIDCPGSTTSYLIKVRFKRWGKLWSPGNVRLLALNEADRTEKRDQALAHILNQVPMPAALRSVATTKRYAWKKRKATGGRSSRLPSHFVLECYNPGSLSIDLTITLRPLGVNSSVPYERLISVGPGFCREAIPVGDISRWVNLHQPFGIDVVPNEIEDGATLFFGLMDFADINQHITEADGRAAVIAAGNVTERSVKCVVWDLDHTVWSGVLMEDGPEQLQLKPGMKEVIRELDRRGILQSVASKNHYEDAMAVLKREGLEEYFLYPQISWGPKSEGIKAIAKNLNIGLDTFLFVDDSAFECAEVAAACPSVRVLNADRYLELPVLRECQVPVTEESANRREMYRQAAVREAAAAQFGRGDYLEFLRECGMEMRLERLSTANLERVHELTQRTNQMNFSGNRYTRTVLETLMATDDLDTFVLSCKDRFGTYGVVGFSVIKASEPRMIDLMFSCRVQSKRVEHAFLHYVVSRYRRGGAREFWVNYRKTPKNEPAGRVFSDVGMVEKDSTDGVTSLMLPHGREIPDDRVVSVVDLLESPVSEARWTK